MRKLDYFFMETVEEQFSFVRMPRALIKDTQFKSLSSRTKQLYSLMLDRTALSKKNGWCDEEGRIYICYRYTDIMDDLDCARGTCAKSIKELEEAGLIETKRHGQGKPNRIYVKRIAIAEDPEEKFVGENDDNNVCPEVQKLDFSITEEDTSKDSAIKVDSQKSNMQTSKSSEKELPEVQNLDSSYTENNYNNHNYTNPIYPSISVTGAENDGLRQIIRRNIDYDAWIARTSYADRGIIECLYQIMCDVICIPRSTIRIGQTIYPYQPVREKFLQIRSDHIEYVLECLKRTTTEIRDIWSYLLQALYRSTITIDGYYQQAVQHDWYYGTSCIEEEVKRD